MADVTRPRPVPGCGERDDRGQLFLVAALSLAVLFVSLALLLNTAIFTENLATRNTDPGTDPSISYRSAAIEAAEDLLIRESANNTNDQPPSVVQDRYAHSVDEWSDGTGLHSARRARFVDLSVSSTTMGTRFEQTNANRNFTNASETTENWELAPSRSVRDVQFTVERSSLVSTDLGLLSADEPFRLYLEDSSDPTRNWSVYIYREGINDVSVAVSNETTTVECSASVGSHAVVDVTGGTINDTACPEFEQTLDIDGGSVDVDFEEGGEAVGTYSLIVSGPANPGSDPDIVDNEVDGSPFVSAVLYEASVTVTYESTDVNYQTTIDIDPPEEL